MDNQWRYPENWHYRKCFDQDVTDQLRILQEQAEASQWAINQNKREGHWGLGSEWTRRKPDEQHLRRGPVIC